MTVHHRPRAYLSNIRFLADMTKRDGAVIPLGVVLEVVWPAKGRWFGLLGRSVLTAKERRQVNLNDFPELSEPWEFMVKEFNSAWEENAGTSCVSLAKKFRWSLNVTPPQQIEIPELVRTDQDIELDELAALLDRHIRGYGARLTSIADSAGPSRAAVRPALPDDVRTTTVLHPVAA